jgi:hypothetical protein
MQRIPIQTGKLDLFFGHQAKDLAFLLPTKPQIPQPFANLYIATRTWVDAALIIPSEVTRGQKKQVKESK